MWLNYGRLAVILFEMKNNTTLATLRSIIIKEQNKYNTIQHTEILKYLVSR